MWSFMFYVICWVIANNIQGSVLFSCLLKFDIEIKEHKHEWIMENKKKNDKKWMQL